MSGLGDFVDVAVGEVIVVAGAVVGLRWVMGWEFGERQEDW